MLPGIYKRRHLHVCDVRIVNKFLQILCNCTISRYSMFDTINPTEMIGIADAIMISKAEQILRNSQIMQGCSTSVFSLCSIKPSALAPVMPQTSTSVSATILPTPKLQNKTPQLDSPRFEMPTETAMDESSFTVTVSTSAIVFIVIGGVLFITLIILVFVLIACVCTKKKSNQTSKRSQPDESLGKIC